MNKQHIQDLLTRALREGDTYVIEQRGRYTQVGLRSADGSVTVNITAAVCSAFAIPHAGRCAMCDAATLRGLLPELPAAHKPKRESALPDFDAMSDADKIAWIVDHPDAITSAKSRGN